MRSAEFATSQIVIAGMSLPIMARLTIMIALEKAVLKGAGWLNWVVLVLGLVVWIFPNSLMVL